MAASRGGAVRRTDGGVFCAYALSAGLRAGGRGGHRPASGCEADSHRFRYSDGSGGGRKPAGPLLLLQTCAVHPADGGGAGGRLPGDCGRQQRLGRRRGPSWNACAAGTGGAFAPAGVRCDKGGNPAAGRGGVSAGMGQAVLCVSGHQGPCGDKNHRLSAGPGGPRRGGVCGGGIDRFPPAFAGREQLELARKILPEMRTRLAADFACIDLDRVPREGRET